MKHALLISVTLAGLFCACNSNKKTKPNLQTTVLSADDSIRNLIKVKDLTPPKVRWCTELTPVNEGFAPEMAAGALSVYQWKWKPGEPHRITVTFNDGNIAIQNRVKAIAAEWEKFTGARFVYLPNNQNADIKISFAKKGVSWSHIGTDSRKYNPSMNFGWLDEESVDSLFQSVVLHEFGHAIGLVHEHQLPDGNPIQWNEDSVYAYYLGPPNFWDVKDVKENIFHKYSRDQLVSGEFDPNSIMMYYIPPNFTKNGYSTPLNVRLSPNDKKLVADVYRR